jgi:SsrA-binding protein
MAVLALNKKARFDYQILEPFEAGLVLTGQEVKSVRAGHMRLNGAYVTIARGAVWLVGSHVPRYPQAGPLPDYDPERMRQVLLHKREYLKLVGKLKTKGLTLVPLQVYTLGSRIKLEFGLARGKKEFQKKETIKQRDLDRDIRRTVKY